MKYLSRVALIIIFVLSAFPASSDAFSRRSSHSEVAPMSAGSTGGTETDRMRSSTAGVSAAAVPEPPVLWLMSLGFALLVVGAMFRRRHRAEPRTWLDHSGW